MINQTCIQNEIVSTLSQNLFPFKTEGTGRKLVSGIVLRLVWNFPNKNSFKDDIRKSQIVIRYAKITCTHTHTYIYNESDSEWINL